MYRSYPIISNYLNIVCLYFILFTLLFYNVTSCHHLQGNKYDWCNNEALFELSSLQSHAVLHQYHDWQDTKTIAWNDCAVLLQPSCSLKRPRLKVWLSSLLFVRGEFTLSLWCIKSHRIQGKVGISPWRTDHIQQKYLQPQEGALRKGCLGINSECIQTT